MKANSGKGNNILRDHWETPQDLFNELNNQYRFEFDCCALKDNSKCLYWSNDFENIKDFNGVFWMNPPFSIAWKMFEHFFKVVKHGVAIYRCDNFETGLWQKIIFQNCDWVFIPNRRISYEGINGDGARFPSALIGIGVNPPNNLTGTLIKPMLKERQRDE